MKNKIKLALFGIGAGLCNGLFGSGGGMIVVPALEKVCSVDTKNAHSTAIAIILPLTIVSIFKYSAFGSVDTSTLVTVCLGGVLGSFAGAKLLKRFTNIAVRRIFGTVIIIAAVRMVIL